MFEKFTDEYAKFKRYVKWLYCLYELNTQIAICEPWEKVFCNVLLGSCISLILYATYAYVPGYCLLLISIIMPISSNTNNTSNLVCAEAEAGICSGSSSQSFIT